MKTFKELLIELNACKEAINWAKDKTIEETVAQCERGEWLLWLAQEIEIDKRKLTLAKAHCANTVRHLMQDERSIAAVDTAIRYGLGDATDEELRLAAHAAAAAAAAAYTSADTYNAASYAAAAAAAAADAAAYAADAAAYAAAEKENQIQTADICRHHIGDLIIQRVNELLK